MILPLTSMQRRLVLAALKLAGDGRAWDSLSMADIAKMAKIPRQEAMRIFPDRTALIPVLVQWVDEAMEQGVSPDHGDNTSVRDRLFEVFMARFDVLQSHRVVVLSMAAAARRRPRWGRALLCAQRRSMERVAAVAKLDEAGQGAQRCLQGMGLHIVYGFALRRWMRDESADMATTMAALDQALRYAEKAAVVMERGAEKCGA